MQINFCESGLESTIIEKLIGLGFSYGMTGTGWSVERKLDSFINEDVLRERLSVINKGVKPAILDEALTTVKQIDIPSLFARNHKFHKYLVDGITVIRRTRVLEH